MSRSARRHWSRHQSMMAAYMAGSGASAADIREAVGVDSVTSVYSFLNKRGFSLVPKSGSQAVVRVVFDRGAMQKYASLARAKHDEPEWLIGRLLEEVAAEKLLLGELVDQIRSRETEP